MSIDTSRRAFFRRAGRKISEAVVEKAEKTVQAQTRVCFRPPFALNELEFLLACMRCGSCVDACEAGVLFSLPGQYGVKLTGTPAMDLLNRACLLCDDWPCVSACQYGALKRPDTELQQAEYKPCTESPERLNLLPRMAKIGFDEDRCLPFFGPECGFCVSVCPVEGAIRLVNEKPVINEQVCVGCAQCRDACVTDPSSIQVHMLDS